MTASEIALRAALRLGLPCFPVGLDKHPTLRHWPLKATADPGRKVALWRCNPGPLVGVPTGEASDLVLLDIDAPRHPEGAAWLAENRCRLPATREHRTRSGGLHLLFRHAAGVRNTQSRPVLGVDVRGEGGYMIWWPAAGFPVFSNAPPAPWPQWLSEILWPPAAIRPRVDDGVGINDRRLGGLVRAVASADEGRRNGTLYWAVHRLREMGGSAAELAFGEETLAIAAMRAGLPENEVRRTVASALGHNPGK